MSSLIIVDLFCLWAVWLLLVGCWLLKTTVHPHRIGHDRPLVPHLAALLIWIPDANIQTGISSGMKAAYILKEKVWVGLKRKLCLWVSTCVQWCVHWCAFAYVSNVDVSVPAQLREGGGGDLQDWISPAELCSLICFGEWGKSHRGETVVRKVTLVLVLRVTMESEEAWTLCLLQLCHTWSFVSVSKESLLSNVCSVIPFGAVNLLTNLPDPWLTDLLPYYKAAFCYQIFFLLCMLQWEA